jgi:hypothetical protein
MVLVKIFFGHLGDRDAILAHIARPWRCASRFGRSSVMWNAAATTISTGGSRAGRHLRGRKFTIRWASETEEAIRSSRGS